MSKEEIINKANLIIENHREIDKMMVIEMVDLVQGLLDLYNKEKQKNERQFTVLCEYEDKLEHYEFNVFKEIAGYIDLDEFKKIDEIKIKGKKYIAQNLYDKQIIDFYNKLNLEFTKNYISKDKIKAKIEEIQNMYDELPKNPKEHLHSRTEYLIVIGELQSLLGKEKRWKKK